MKSIVLLIALAAAPAPQTEVMTLDQAIQVALENNRTLVNAGLEVAKAKEHVAASRTRRLPSFNSYALGSRQLSRTDLWFERGAFGVFDGIGPIPAVDTTIRSPGRFSFLMINEISQPITQLHRIGLGIKQAQLNVDVSGEQLRVERHSVIASIKNAYFAILQTESSLRASEQNIRLYRELDRLTEQYVLQRVSLKSESLEVKTRLAKSQLDALTLQDTLANRKEQLNSLLGRDLQTDFSVSLAPDAELVKVELRQAQLTALSKRPEVRQARLKVDQAELDRRAKRSEFIPEVSFNVSNTSPINYSDVLPKNITTAGIAMNWEVFDWGRKKRELAVKDASINQAANALREAESIVIREVSANHRQLERTAQMLRLAVLGQETASESLRVTANSYGVNAALLKDVLQSEAAMAQANDQYQQALLSFWTAKSQLDKSMGEDHE